MTIYLSILLAALSGIRNPQEPSIYELKGFQKNRADAADYFGYDPFRDVTPGGKSERLYELRFKKNERFVFVLPTSILDTASPPDLWADGWIAHTWDHDRDPKTPAYDRPIPKRLIRIRNTLLAAYDYFESEATRAKVPFHLFRKGEPIRVMIGAFASGTKYHAYARYRNQVINFRHEMSLDGVVPYAIHELFHFAQDMVCNTDNRAYIRHDNRSTGIWRSFLQDMTCQWAEDEPIRIPNVGRPGFTSADEINHWLSNFGRYFFIRNELGFFSDGEKRYEAAVLMKYLTEQLAGGKDGSGVEPIYQLHRSVYKKGPVTRNTLLKSLGEILPVDRYPGATWEERLLQFYREYAASTIVQRAGFGNDPADRLGFHDDGFQNLKSMYPVRRRELRLGYSRRPRRAYPEAATDEAERRSRLKTIIQKPEFVKNLAHHVYLIDLDRAPASWWKPVPNRPVFLYAEAFGNGTNVFALRQSTRSANFRDREGSTFSLNSRFRFRDPSEGKNRNWALAEIPPADSGTPSRFLWMGLVNAARDDASREFRYAFVASPRLVPRKLLSISSRKSKTVRLRTVNSKRHAPKDSLFNGDTFSFEVVVSDEVHSGPIRRADIPPEERTLQFEIVSVSSGKPVRLVEKDGQSLRVSSSKSTRGFRYKFVGQIAEDNPHLGECKVRIRLSSLLNLGQGDEQIDESLSLHVENFKPSVVSVRVRSESLVVYDSQALVHKPALAKEDKYRLEVSVEFTKPMDPKSTAVKAGFQSPYDRYPAADLKWDGNQRTVTGSLSISKKDVPKGGAVLTLRIAGKTEDDIDLDTDATRPKNQPDTSHAVLLDLEGYYELTIERSSRFRKEVRHGSSVERRSAEMGPIRFKMKLGPSDNNIPFDVLGPEFARILLQQWSDTRNGLEPFIKVAKTLRDRMKKATEESPDRKDLRKYLSEREEELKILQAALKEFDVIHPKVKALARLAGGYRIYSCNSGGGRRFGSLPASVAGASSTYSHIYRQGSSLYTAKADPWVLEDVGSSGWGKLYETKRLGQWLSLIVWTFDPEDIEILRDLLRNPPKVVMGKNQTWSLNHALVQIVVALWQITGPTSRSEELRRRNTGVGRKLVLSELDLPPLTKKRLYFLQVPGNLFATTPMTGKGDYVNKSNDKTYRGTFKIRVGFDNSNVYLPQPLAGSGLNLTRLSGTWSWEDQQPHQRFEVVGPDRYFRIYSWSERDSVQGGLIQRIGKSRMDAWRWKVAFNGRPVPREEEVAEEERARTGSISGVISIPKDLKTGGVVVYLDGDGLEQAGRQSLPLPLKGRFKPEFSVLPLDSKITFKNDDTKAHWIVSHSPALATQVEIEPGKDQGYKLDRRGKFRFRDTTDGKDHTILIVVPNRFYSVGESGYQFPDVPPGTYTLRVVAGSSNIQRISKRIKIEAGKGTVLDLDLEARN